MYRLLLAVAFLMLLFSPAFAQAASDTTVSFAPLITALLPYLATLLSLLATAALGWLATLLQKKVNIDLTQSSRDALHSALTTGINLALSKLQPEGGKLTLDVKDKTIAQAITWAETSVPEAIQHFGLTPDALRSMVASKLNVADPAVPSIPPSPVPIAS